MSSLFEQKIAEQLSREISSKFSVHATVVENEVRIERHSGHEFIPTACDLVSRFY